MKQVAGLLSSHSAYQDTQRIDFPKHYKARIDRYSKMSTKSFETEKDPCPLYVFCDFIKPGKH